jgi:hypothetical protein
LRRVQQRGREPAAVVTPTNTASSQHALHVEREEEEHRDHAGDADELRDVGGAEAVHLEDIHGTAM